MLMKPAIALLALLALGAGCSSAVAVATTTEPATTVPATEAATTTVPATTSTTTTVAATTTLAATTTAAVTTTAAPTTTVAPATTLSASDAGDVTAALTMAWWASQRDKVIPILAEADTSIRSVDVYKVEPWLFTVAVTTGFHGLEYRDSTAWSLARAMGTMWKPGETTFLNPDGTDRMALLIKVDSTAYLASYDLMVGVAATEVDSVSWLAAARGR